MITKSITVFWTVVCFTAFLRGDLNTMALVVTCFLWGIVVVPTTLIGQLFKKDKVYTPGQNAIRAGVLIAIGGLAFLLIATAPDSNDKVAVERMRRDYAETQKRLDQEKAELRKTWDRLWNRNK